MLTERDAAEQNQQWLEAEQNIPLLQATGHMAWTSMCIHWDKMQH